jgi:hypothetical protein
MHTSFESLAKVPSMNIQPASSFYPLSAASSIPANTRQVATSGSRIPDSLTGVRSEITQQAPPQSRQRTHIQYQTAPPPPKSGKSSGGENWPAGYDGGGSRNSSSSKYSSQGSNNPSGYNGSQGKSSSASSSGKFNTNAGYGSNSGNMPWRS